MLSEGCENPSEHPHYEAGRGIDRLGRNKITRAGDGEDDSHDAGAGLTSADGEHSDGYRGEYSSRADGVPGEVLARTCGTHIRLFGMDFNMTHRGNNRAVRQLGMEKVRQKAQAVMTDLPRQLLQLMLKRSTPKEPIRSICDEFNEAGLRTSRGNPFGVKTLHRMLKNRLAHWRAGTGMAGSFVPGRMAFHDQPGDVLNRAQKRFAENKRKKGSQRAREWTRMALLAIG